MKATAASPDFVRRLIVHEAGQAPNHQGLTEAAERVCENLRLHLTKRVGQDGYRTLLVRALTLATVEFPPLSVVRVAADGTLEGLRPPPSGEPQSRESEGTGEETTEGVVILLEHLIGLLITFIGEDLTLRMVSTVWPTLHLDANANDAPGMKEETS